MANSRGFLKRRQTVVAGGATVDPREVARVAYELFEQRGRVDGHDFEDWLKAETIVRQHKSARGAL